jgi:hypothetical protein
VRFDRNIRLRHLEQLKRGRRRQEPARRLVESREGSA